MKEDASYCVKGYQESQNGIKYQWGIDLTFQFPSQMLHVIILAGAI